MTPELNLLVWSIVLTFVQAIIAVVGANSQISLATLAGN
jgi:hypothetical protein